VIEVFTKPNCPRCPVAKSLLKKALAARGLKYEEVVKERNVEEDPEAMTDLLMLGSASTPTLKIGDRVLIGEEATQEKAVEEAIDRLKSRG
jgi:glutaredoxin